jgi:hypothetical protein
MIRRGFIQTLLATPVVACLPKPKPKKYIVSATVTDSKGHVQDISFISETAEIEIDVEEWVRRTVEARFDEVFKQYCITGNGVVR